MAKANVKADAKTASPALPGPQPSLTAKVRRRSASARQGERRQASRLPAGRDRGGAGRGGRCPAREALRPCARHPGDLGSRRARAQPQERRPDDPPRQARGVHRAVGLGQVVARLRHDLCRGAAPLRRVALGLCPPVPGDDAEARRRPDRRALARHLHRAEDHLEEPALDGRHGHRDLRLHAPALGAGRHPLLAGHRPADREPDRAARWSTGCWRCRRRRRLYLLAPVVRGRKGEYRKEIAEFQKKGFQRLQDRRRATTPIDDVPTLDKKLKHDIDVVVDRIVVRPDIARAPGRIRSRPRWNSPTASPSSSSPTRREGGADARAHHLLVATSPARSRASRSPRSSRGCSPSTIPSAPARPAAASATRCGSTPTSSIPDGPEPEARRHRALGEIDLALLRPDPRRARQALQGFTATDALAEPAGEGPRRHPVRLGRRSRSASPTTTACAPTR